MNLMFKKNPLTIFGVELPHRKSIDFTMDGIDYYAEIQISRGKVVNFELWEKGEKSGTSSLRTLSEKNINVTDYGETFFQDLAWGISECWRKLLKISRAVIHSGDGQL